jgi:hypothetical protein
VSLLLALGLLLAVACADADATAAGSPAVSGAVGGVTVRRLLLPPPSNLFQNSGLAVAGDALFVAGADYDVLWSFSLATGRLLDHEGLWLPAPALASNPHLFASSRLVVPGWFPQQALLVADVHDPAALRLAGTIALPPTSNVQGMLPHTADGAVGFVASFGDDHLYSFDAQALRLLDADGLALPGNPDRTVLASGPAPRILAVDTTAGAIMVVDVSTPSALRLAGTVTIPGAHFSSANTLTLAADGRTVFLTSQDRTLWSVDSTAPALLDADGLALGKDGGGLSVAIDERDGQRRLAVLSQQGVSLVDAANPSRLSLLREVDFGSPVLIQGDANAVFSADGSLLAVPLVAPQMALAIVDVASGRLRGTLLRVGEQPNHLERLGDDRLAVICAGKPYGVWVVDGAFAAARAAAPSAVPPAIP